MSTHSEILPDPKRNFDTCNTMQSALCHCDQIPTMEGKIHFAPGFESSGSEVRMASCLQQSRSLRREGRGGLCACAVAGNRRGGARTISPQRACARTQRCHRPCSRAGPPRNAGACGEFLIQAIKDFSLRKISRSQGHILCDSTYLRTKFIETGGGCQGWAGLGGEAVSEEPGLPTRQAATQWECVPWHPAVRQNLGKMVALRLCVSHLQFKLFCNLSSIQTPLLST